MTRWHGGSRTVEAAVRRVGIAAVLALLSLAWNGAPAQASTTVLQARLAAVAAVRGEGSAAELVVQLHCSALAEVQVELTLLQVVSGRQLAAASGDLLARCAKGSHAFAVPLVGDRRLRTGEAAATLRLTCRDLQPCEPVTSERIVSVHAGVNLDRPVATSAYNASLSAALGYSAHLRGQGARVVGTARLACRHDTIIQALLTQPNADGSLHTESTDVSPRCTGAPHHATIEFTDVTSPFHPGLAFLQLYGFDCTELDAGGSCSSVVTWREVALT